MFEQSLVLRPGPDWGFYRLDPQSEEDGEDLAVAEKTLIGVVLCEAKV
jgi:hypothetical protein